MAINNMPDPGISPQKRPVQSGGDTVRYRRLDQGLTEQDVAQRVREGRVNTPPKSPGKTVPQIIFTNVFTFFNLLNLAFFVLILIVGSYKNGLFMMIIIVNSAIGIIQELRTKKTLDSLAILTASHAEVIRDGEHKKIDIKEIVEDDLIVLSTGDQIPTDCRVISGNIECNESMLTGESEAVSKNPGASVFSGAFVTSGKALCQVVHVGKNNYIETISGEAKKVKAVNSQLRNSINQILHLVSYFIVPLCAALFAKMYFLLKQPLKASVESMVTSGIGMIPEGVVLLTSAALTLGVLRLARERTVVQELYCIETLARVDVLCLDKTGTLTEGKVKVEKTVNVAGSDNDLREGFQNIIHAQNDLNDTAEGIREYYHDASSPWQISYVIPFSSDRKYSGAAFKDHGTYYMGAFQFLMPYDRVLEEAIHPYLEEGYRVILLCHSETEAESNTLPDDLKPLGFLVMSDVIRKDCEKTLGYFKEQGVELRVISGDDPLTVSKIAMRCGLENADRYCDASKITSLEEMKAAVEKYVVFGRVRPEQKKMMVECLQAAGKTVAMTGDGVNDVLALKTADCSIAMASGSEAAKHAANIVLLDSDFTSMPHVVNEGRRVINNICNATSLYLIKTTFSILLTIGTLFLGRQYPFQAVQLSIISGCAVGIPTFFLQLEPSFRKIRSNFMELVFRNALPAGIVIAIVTLMITNIGIRLDASSQPMLSTICVLCIGWIYFFMLKRIYSPMTTYRRIVCYVMEISYLIVMTVGQHILELTAVSVAGIMILFGIITLSPIMIDLFETVYDKKLGPKIQEIAERNYEKPDKKKKRKEAVAYH
ncbi:MAG: HAD-IC family P-type ATPase [Lachnospiraceae bacterium]|nr:HAD-IC family P-type ATPase [Lachnospiraceae bacterium]